MTPDYKEILQAIREGKWQWMKVKRFKPEAYPTIEERYAALEAHHVEETTFMLNVIRGLCEQLEAKDES